MTEPRWLSVRVGAVVDNGKVVTATVISTDITIQKKAEEEIRKHRDHLEELVHERTMELESISNRLRLEIAERQKAQETLLEEKQQTEAILRYVADAIMLTDIAGNILYVNPAWEQITGYSLDEVRGKNPRFLQTGKTQRSTYEDLWQNILEGGTWTGLFLNRRKDQVEYDSMATITPVKSVHGDIIHFVEVHRDITQERQLAAMKEEFIANAAHDLNNPITVLQTSLHLLRRDPSQVERRLVVFEEQVNLLQSLVDDLLTVSRLDRHIMPLALKLIDLNNMVAKVIEAQNILASRKDLTLMFATNGEIPLIQADLDLMRRVVMNLIANAINYTPIRGKITVTVNREVTFVVFTVEDTGIGISTHDLPHIFDRFYRSDNARATTQGTGLGLAIVREIVELHRGKIDVKSRLGEGTRFRVYIPVEH
jgi:two-component system phosphate regulon sensor histidine kinase PhoR